MKRRSFFQKGLTAGIGIAGTSGLMAIGKKKPRVQGAFVHMVFFWLNETTNVEDFKKSTAELMEQINEVVSYHVGVPAGTPREVVDNSYGVCLIATFASKEDQDTYQKHPVHLKYIEENNQLWNRVQIYDSWAG